VARCDYIGGRHAVGIKQLKDRPSEHARITAAGGTILVTDRDRVVAELGPPLPKRPQRLGDAVVAEWVRKGLATPGSLPRATRPPARRLILHEQPMADLERDREDR
jgi:antitoxin (DNA-binding transcriptional repressor) of toxin-antitoxin stability system